MDTHTVIIAISYLDRYLSNVSVFKVDMQLLSLATLLLASKMNESGPIVESVVRIHAMYPPTHTWRVKLYILLM